jgi:RecA-family ATPase
MGADCSRILVIDESKEELTMTDERLEEAIKETGAKLLVLDPIQAYLGAQVDMHRANEIRPILKKLGMLAEKYNCAIVLIGHMNKANGAKSTYRGLGSIDFQATARSVLVVGRLKDKPNIRIIAHDKSSLAPEGQAIAFELDTEEGFKLLGHYDISVDDLLSGIDKENKLKKAETLLEDVLVNGRLMQSEILKKANGMDISKRVLDQAKKNLEVKSIKIQDKWYWQLGD